MSINLVALATILLLMSLSDVLFFVLMGVCGCGWNISSGVLRMGTAVLGFTNNAPSSVSTVDYIKLRMIVDMLRTASLFGFFLVN